MRYFLLSFMVSIAVLSNHLEERNLQTNTAPENFSTSHYWDLTYKSLLKKYNIRWDRQDGTLFTWLENDPAEQELIMEFVQQPLEAKVLSSFLIEHPTLPDGGRLTVWGIQTERDTYFWVRSSKKGPKQFQKISLPKEKYTSVFNQLASLTQKTTFGSGDPDQSYAGFLSIYHGEKSNQLLLHVSDFLEIDAETNETIGLGTIYSLEANELEIRF